MDFKGLISTSRQLMGSNEPIEPTLTITLIYLKGNATATGPKISSMTTVEAEFTLVIRVGG